MRRAQRGFTMLEVLIATALMIGIIGALATVTAQWIPNWNRGMVRVQQLDRLAVGIDRIASDLAASEFVPLNGSTKAPLFTGAALSVTFVRTAVGPNARPGLEFVRLVERADQQGLALVRESRAFLPVAREDSIQFGAPVVLIRAPYRISFSYAGAAGDWLPVWQNVTELPRRIRISVRDAQTDRVVVASTIVTVQVGAAAECAKAKNIEQCLVTGQAEVAAPPGAPPGQNPNEDL